MINSDFPQPTHPRRTAEDQAKVPPNFPKPVRLVTTCTSLDFMRVLCQEEGKGYKKIKKVLVPTPNDSDSDNDSESDSSSSSSDSSCARMDLDDDVKMPAEEQQQQQQQEATTTKQATNQGNNKDKGEVKEEVAYWIRRTKADTQTGKIKIATILKKRQTTTAAGGEGGNVEWQLTDRKCAIKCVSWKMMERNLVSDDPRTEALAMHFLKQWHNEHSAPLGKNIEDSHVIFPLDFLEAEKFFYIVMPYGDEDLCDRVFEKRKFEEEEARYWMDQILAGLETLQKAGVCHRDISLENLVIYKDKLLIIDMGLSLLIPFDNKENDGDAMDVDDGNNDNQTHRRRYLIKEQEPRGKARYMSPEIHNKIPFDGYAVDLWAVGVVLFIMLTGKHPWDLPSREYINFRQITSGDLEDNLRGRGLGPLSADAVDLLQKMMREDPRERFSLEQVRAHTWMTQGERRIPEKPMGP